MSSPGAPRARAGVWCGAQREQKQPEPVQTTGRPLGWNTGAPRHGVGQPPTPTALRPVSPSHLEYLLPAAHRRAPSFLVPLASGSRQHFRKAFY